jgi:hypothetical protein
MYGQEKFIKIAEKTLNLSDFKKKCFFLIGFSNKNLLYIKWEKNEFWIKIL